MQCTRWCNEDGALADKVLVVDDGEGGIFGYAADGEGCCLEAEGFAEEGVEEGIGEEGVEVEGGGSGIVWVCGVFVYGGEDLIAGGGGEDVEHVPHCSGEGICLSQKEGFGGIPLMPTACPTFLILHPQRCNRTFYIPGQRRQ